MKTISCESVTKQFGEFTALNEVSFSIEKGEYVGFLGPNGAGKTTTIHCLLGLMNPSAGIITVLDRNPWSSAQQNNSHVGYIPSDPYFYPELTGAEHITYVSQLCDSVDQALLRSLITDLQFDPSVKTGLLSTGNKQKLSIILALMNRPTVLIMDEPTRGLDPLLQKIFFDYVARAHQQGATIFVSSHNLAEVQQYCTRVLLIKSGKIIEDARVSELASKQLHTVTLTVEDAEKAQKQLIKHPQVSLAVSEARKLVLHVEGDVKTVLSELHKVDFSDISISGATLEEIFMKYYQ